MLDSGVHTVDVTAEAHRPEHRELELAPGTRAALDVRLTLIDRRARLVVQPSDAEAAIYVDSRLEGTGWTELGLAAGEHTVEVLARGFAPYRETVWSHGLGTIWLRATLRHLPRAYRPPAWLVPAVVVAGVALLSGAALGVVAYATRGVEPPPPTNWGSLPGL